MQIFNQPGFRHMDFPERLTALDVVKHLAHALRVSADALVFEAVERGPDDEMQFQFGPVTRMPKQERDAICTMLEAMNVKNQAAGVREGVAKFASR